MTKEQMQKEIARLNHKIEIESEEVRNLAQRILNGADNPYNITFHCPSRMLAQSENTLKELIARRDTLKEILGEE
ncbi:MAG: hypothetical protein J6W00_00100 [Lentisphaeria bacterium]|nr:hypothetical protein [Lentisphaeria bacterium]